MSVIFYPLILLSTIVVSSYAILNDLDLSKVYSFYLAGLISILIFTEQFHPARTEWKINRKLFFRRDLPYMLVGGLTLGLANFIVGYFSITLSANNSHALWDMPIVFDFILSLLIIDFIWYWYHRWCHENTSQIGNFLWNVHVAHHLPKQVYILMHGVSHPLNTLIARGIMNTSIYPRFLRRSRISSQYFYEPSDNDIALQRKHSCGFFKLFYNWQRVTPIPS